MRITLDESKMKGSRREHALGTTEQFESIDEVVTYLEARLRELGKAFTVKRYEGSPMQGLVTEIDVHDPPIESLYTITDADAYLERFGYEAEEAAKFLIRNGPFIEALILGDERVAAYYIENQSMTGNLAEPQWLSEWDAIEEWIRDADVMRGVVPDGDTAKPIRTWDVLVGVQRDARPLMVTEGIDGPIEGSPEFLLDRDSPWKLPSTVVQVPWDLLREAVVDGRKVLIGGHAYDP